MAKIKKPKTTIFAICLLLGGLYLLSLVTAPQIKFVASPLEVTPTEYHRDPLPDEDYLYISKINLLVPFASGDRSMLEKGAWWRHPELGNPKTGGNFILSAHRFKLGWTPQHTKKVSPFYHLDKLEIGDDIVVHYQGADYRYKVAKEFSVKPNDNSIESASDTPKLTLYTCTLKGSADGRTVIEADPM